jgi:hypothetical protein
MGDILSFSMFCGLTSWYRGLSLWVKRVGHEADCSSAHLQLVPRSRRHESICPLAYTSLCLAA